MTVPVIAFFNNKGGVGKTSLVYHIAWMLSELGQRVIAADLDPQANLTAAFLDDEKLEELWSAEETASTVFGAIEPAKRGLGDIRDPQLQEINDRLSLIAGDMRLSTFEDDLSQLWSKCNDRDERAFRVTSSFWRVMQSGAVTHRADVILLDLGPNLGAINRSALVSADYLVVPLGPDLFSLQGLKNLGPALAEWRKGWLERRPKNPAQALAIPEGAIKPVGYVVMQHSTRGSTPVKAYDKWISRIPLVYRQAVLEQSEADAAFWQIIEGDEHCLALLRHYRSLMPMAQEARKPVFALRSADGAIGAHSAAVQDAYRDFKKLALAIAERTFLAVPV